MGYPIPDSFEQIMLKKLDGISATVERNLKALTDATVARLSAIETELNDLDMRLIAVEAVVHKPVALDLESLDKRIVKIEEALHPTKVFRDDLPGVTGNGV